jgi:hydrogenase expression/formation protein HypD
MNYIEAFRNPEVAQIFLKKIKQEANPHRKYHLMEFCGGHTHALHRHGIIQLLPKSVKMVHGPGCPVCILPIERIDRAIFLAGQKDVIFCSYADMLRVPGSHQDSLMKKKARGADIRMVYSIEDALAIAQNNTEKKIIFFAIGFETTTPPTAATIDHVIKNKVNNFLIYCNHVLTPVAMKAILSEEVKIDGFIGPSHVSILIGSDAYHTVTEQYRKPMVISGFEPLDILQSIYMLLHMINLNKIGVENQYSRAVTPHGNTLAQDLVYQYLQIDDTFHWRGLGHVPHSSLKIKPEFAHLDAETHYSTPTMLGIEHNACACPDVLRGIKAPEDCKLFRTLCTPENPIGACMVSSEGACAAHYQYH